jgi:L-amino acid N-acyltransferase YncA
MIRLAKSEDAEAIAKIYNHYIESTAITFEETSLSVDEMSSRMGGSKSDLPWFVYELDGTVVGYAYAGQWNQRAAYRHSCEVSIYLDHDAIGKGIGRRLYRHLIDDLRQRGIHVIIGGVALPNPASVALHESLGFEKVAHYREVGRKFGKWIDVGYWQLAFDQAISVDAEERSPDPSPSQ